MIALLSKCGGFADLASLDRQGIILIAGGSVRQFSRRETIGPHTVETAISVYPAVGHGYRGGLATAGVIVTVDGRKKIDCPYDTRDETHEAGRRVAYQAEERKATWNQVCFLPRS